MNTIQKLRKIKIRNLLTKWKRIQRIKEYIKIYPITNQDYIYIQNTKKWLEIEFNYGNSFEDDTREIEDKIKQKTKEIDKKAKQLCKDNIKQNTIYNIKKRMKYLMEDTLFIDGGITFVIDQENKTILDQPDEVKNAILDHNRKIMTKNQD